MTPTIMHVNLAKGFRGGERQTELLIKELATHGLKQYLVCRDNSPLREHLKAVSNLEFITANHQLMGHFAVHQNIDMIHAHEAKAVHWAWIENRLRGTPYILTRRVPQQIKQNLFNKLCYKHASQTVAISSPIASYLAGLQLAPVTTIPSALAHLPHNPDISKEIKKQYPGKFLIGHAGALVDKHKGQLKLCVGFYEILTIFDLFLHFRLAHHTCLKVNYSVALSKTMWVNSFTIIFEPSKLGLDARQWGRGILITATIPHSISKVW